MNPRSVNRKRHVVSILDLLQLEISELIVGVADLGFRDQRVSIGIVRKTDQINSKGSVAPLRKVRVWDFESIIDTWIGNKLGGPNRSQQSTRNFRCERKTDTHPVWCRHVNASSVSERVGSKWPSTGSFGVAHSNRLSNARRADIESPTITKIFTERSFERVVAATDRDRQSG